MRVLMFGSRGWHDPKPINALMAGLDVLAEGRGERLTIIHGNARSGADKLVDQIAHDWKAEVIRVDAEWGRYKAGAGPIRNQRMLDEYQPEIAYGFRANGKSTGTDDMHAKAKAADVPVYILTEG